MERGLGFICQDSYCRWIYRGFVTGAECLSGLSLARSSSFPLKIDGKIIPMAFS